eukprot:4779569-Amphidinium_carterae.1
MVSYSSAVLHAVALVQMLKLRTDSFLKGLSFLTTCREDRQGIWWKGKSWIVATMDHVGFILLAPGASKANTSKGPPYCSKKLSKFLLWGASKL